MSDINLICKISGEEFAVSDQEQDFLGKMQLELPLYSPKIREVMRLAHRNERNLHIRKCDATGEKILSIYRPDVGFPVYKYDYWVTDKWDAPEMDYDFDRPFFEQFNELANKTPHVNVFGAYNENCDYTSAAEKNKNCYMHVLADRCEDCYYTHGIFGCNDCIDCDYCHDCQLCYYCTDCRNCYHCRMCFLSDNSSECLFCFDMRGCQDCFMCNGLRNQKYCFENKQLSKEEYDAKISEIDFESVEIFENYKKRFIDEILSQGKYVRMINTENSDGNFLINTKNCHHCYDVEEAEDCCYFRVGANGCKDVHHSHAIVDGSELIYGNVSTTESYNCHNCSGCWTSRDSAYCKFVQGCKECIGCVSLRYKKNCVLNKQYSPEEYRRIRDHIISELGEYWGSPFPLEMADFTYCDSAYSDYCDMSREEVEKIGWAYGEKRMTEGKEFKIIEQEKRLLKKIGAPLPTKHYEERFRERTKFRKQNMSEL